jgi:DNA-binding IclR family transcriptional regulator
MALEDVARLISMKRPAQVLKLLRCFYGGKSCKLEELMKETGFSEKQLRYYITKMRRLRLIEFDLKSRSYLLDPRGFHVRIDTVFVDAVENLVKRKE